MGRGNFELQEQLLYEQAPFVDYRALVERDLIEEVIAKSKNFDVGPHRKEQWTEADAILEEADYDPHDQLFYPVLSAIVAMDAAIRKQGWVCEGHLREISHSAIQAVLFDGRTWKEAAQYCRELTEQDKHIEVYYSQVRRHQSGKALTNLLEMFRQLNSEATKSYEREAIRFFEDEFNRYLSYRLNSMHCSEEEIMRAIYEVNCKMLEDAIDERVSWVENMPPINELGFDVISAKEIACRCRVIEDLSGETLEHFQRWDSWALELTEFDRSLTSLVEELAPMIASDVDLLATFCQTESYRVIREKVESNPYYSDVRKIEETERALAREFANHLLGKYHPDEPKLVWPRIATLPKN